MSEKEIKRILLTTGYTTQTDKDAIYHYIKELKDVIEEIRYVVTNKDFRLNNQRVGYVKTYLIEEILDKVKEVK